MPTDDHANELVIGFLMLVCISITIVACACCHRNKSGFEVSPFIANFHPRFIFKIAKIEEE